MRKNPFTFKRVCISFFIIVITVASFYSITKIKKTIKLLKHQITKDNDNNQILRYQFYSNWYENNLRSELDFDIETANLSKWNTLSKKEQDVLYKRCQFAVDHAKNLYLSKGYQCIAKIQSFSDQFSDQLRSIKNISYGLDVAYTQENIDTLIDVLLQENKDLVLSNLKLSNNDLYQFFNGISSNEIEFLQKLLSLKVENLSAKVHYRLSMIYNLGRSSNLEISTPDLQKSVIELNYANKLANIKPINITNIAFVLDDNYAEHAAATIASALLNADLDSFYKFYCVMDPKTPISLEYQAKLGSMQNIRNYDIEFVTVDHSKIDMSAVSEIFYKQKIDKRYPFSLVYRLFFDKIFPNLSGLLSLDADLIVLRDLNVFNNLSKQYSISGTYDSYICNCLIRPDCNKILDHYINTGVNYFNLDTIRAGSISKIMEHKLNNTKCDIHWIDQDIINIVFLDHGMKYIPYRWNMWSKFINNEVKTLHHPFIIHYVIDKPWKKLKESELDDIDRVYFRYKGLTPWNKKDKE